MGHDPREGRYDEYRCRVCGAQWIVDFPWHHGAADERGPGILRRWDTMISGRPLNALPRRLEPSEPPTRREP